MIVTRNDLSYLLSFFKFVTSWDYLKQLLEENCDETCVKMRKRKRL
jgi:hypothetical protein